MKMTETELASLVKLRAGDTLGHTGDQLSKDRQTALKYYRGDKFGNEEEGRSQIVSRDVAESVDGLMPPLMRVFFSGDETVRFEPTGQEDVGQADQATDYCNWIFQTQNPGFLIGHTWFKDALLQKIGVVKVWWDDTPKTTEERYRGLSPEELTILEADETIEIGEKEEIVEVVPIPQQMLAAMPANVPVQPIEIRSYNVTVTRTNTDGQVCVANVPPEEFGIARSSVALDDSCLYAHHQYLETVSGLIAMGFDREKVMSAGYDDETRDLTGERAVRFDDEDQIPWDEWTDETTRKVLVTEAYIRVDYDGDGEAELRKVTCLGDGYEVVDNEQVDDFPFACITPIPMPHKFHGLSVADQTMDIQEWKSAIVRQMNNNLYLNNEPRLFVKGKVNMDDLLNSRLAAPIRGEMNSEVTPLTVPFFAKEGFAMLEYIDSMREMRTGITRYSQGLDANALNKTATGIQIIQEAAQGRQELIARVIAETGFKRLFKLVLKLVCKYQQRPKMIRLRGEWVPMDPRSWKNSWDVAVAVGLGTGNKDQQLQRGMAMLGIDERLIALQGGLDGPLVNAKNVHAKLEKMVEAVGWKTVEPYYMNPETAPPQQPRPDPKMIEAQGKMELEKQRAQVDLQKMQAELALQRDKIQGEMALQRDKMMMEFQLEAWKCEQQHGMSLGSLDTESVLQAVRIDAEIALQQQKMEHERQMNEAKLAHEVEIGGRRIDNERAVAERKVETDSEIQTRRVEMEGKREERKIEGSAAGKSLKSVEASNKAIGQVASGMDSLMTAIKALVERVEKIEEVNAKPKTIDIKRDKSGEIVGGTVTQGGRKTEVVLQ